MWSFHVDLRSQGITLNNKLRPVLIVEQLWKVITKIQLSRPIIIKSVSDSQTLAYWRTEPIYVWISCMRLLTEANFFTIVSRSSCIAHSAFNAMTAKFDKRSSLIMLRRYVIISSSLINKHSHPADVTAKVSTIWTPIDRNVTGRMMMIEQQLMQLLVVHDTCSSLYRRQR